MFFPLTGLLCSNLQLVAKWTFQRTWFRRWEPRPWWQEGDPVPTCQATGLLWAYFSSSWQWQPPASLSPWDAPRHQPGWEVGFGGASTDFWLTVHMIDTRQVDLQALWASSLMFSGRRHMWLTHTPYGLVPKQFRWCGFVKHALPHSLSYDDCEFPEMHIENTQPGVSICRKW